MTTGKYLRTNYRRTGGLLDATALGGGVLLGTNSTLSPPAYGGFMCFSYAFSAAGDTAVDVAAGWSHAWGDSTFGTMSLYYGSGVYSGGYVFMPVGWMGPFCMSVMAGVSLGGELSQASHQTIKLVGQGVSDSVWRMSFMRFTNAGSLSALSTTGMRALVWGFIVSGP